jgi:starch phosphorylase
MSSPKTPARPTSGDLSPGAGVRTGLSVADLKQSFLDHLFCGLGRVPAVATRNDAYTALAFTVRDRLLKRGVRTLEAYAKGDVRAVAYLSAEFLPGPHLANNLLNLGITEQVRQALSELGVSLDNLTEQEEEPGLGNGGLGRLASCFWIRSRRWRARSRLRHSLRVRDLRSDDQGRLASRSHGQVAPLR